MNADSIRLRAPDGTPLRWKREPPLTVGLWDDTPDRIRSAVAWSLDGWNRGVGLPLLRLAPRGTPTWIWFGAWGIESTFGGGAAGHGPVGSLLGRGRAPDTEFASCELYWDASHRGLAADIRISAHLARTDTRASVSHELGHALLLGHDSSRPWRLMYPSHTAVTRPTKAEARWVGEIWGGDIPRSR